MTRHGLLGTIGFSVLLAGSVALPAQAAGPNFTGNVIVEGSLCVGFDCVPGMAFGFDTIVLQENNLRIFFNDTSSTASFPPNDWRLTANDTTNGGASHFSIEDASAGRVVFRVFAGARSNALVVDAQGDLGLGTSTPATDIDIKTGNTPTVRLQQDGTSGFTPQTWDLAGNETNFFVRDVTNGSLLPFRIRPTAPSNSIYVDIDGDVGMGTSSPGGALHIRKGSGLGFVQLEDSSTGRSWFFTHQGNSAFSIARDDAGAERLQLRGDGSFQVGGNGTAGNGMALDAAGNLAIGGSLTQNSDRNSKMAIVEVDTRDILEKLADLPITSWTYKADADQGTRHIGPMAQDFYALFGTGRDEKGISSIDASGVALAAIQALAEENAELRTLLQDQAARHEARIRLLEEKAAN